MKLIFLSILATAFGLQVSAQSMDLLSYEKERISIDKTGMLVLGGWSVVNIATGAIGTNSNNREHKYFHQMNMIWNGVNLLLAGAGYLGAVNEKTDNLTLTKVLLHQNAKEKTFIFNAGLDLAYITGGLYLKERSRRNADPSKLKGYGNSIMLQGGFLLIFDAVMYTLHHQHGKKLGAFTDKVTLVGTPVGMAITYQLGN